MRIEKDRHQIHYNKVVKGETSKGLVKEIEGNQLAGVRGRANCSPVMYIHAGDNAFGQNRVLECSRISFSLNWLQEHRRQSTSVIFKTGPRRNTWMVCRILKRSSINVKKE